MRKRVVGSRGAMVVIISGPSGVGKDTIIRILREREANPQRHFVITYKTRVPRASEVDGADYQFVSLDEFAQLHRRGALLEASEVHGHWSGTPRDQVAAALTEGHDAILKIDVQGADKIKALIPEAVRIFVAPPSSDVRQRRLADRGTESPEEQEIRNLDAEIEMGRQHDFDYVVVNETGQAEVTADEIDRIIRDEHDRHPDRQIRL
ncbi:MAG: guanylate kinase [Chloroflexota bacterium]|nr:guanylate kinase [Chloroflexota bacterium]